MSLLLGRAHEIVLAATQNAEATPIVSIGVIILTTVIPAGVLTAVIWIFVRASRRDPEIHALPEREAEPGRGG